MTTERLTRAAQGGDLNAARLLLREAQRRGDTELCHVACDALVTAGEWSEVLAWCEAPLCYCDGRGCRHCDCRLCGCGVCSCCSGQCRCDCGPQPTHRLCNLVGRVAELTSRTVKCGVCDRFSGQLFVGGDDVFMDCWMCNGAGKLTHPDNQDARRVWTLYDRLGELWWPGGWWTWLRYAMPGQWAFASEYGGSDRSIESACSSYILKRGDVRMFGVSHLPPLAVVPECVCDGAGVERGRCPVSVCENGKTPHNWDHHFRIEGLMVECTTCHGTGRCPRCGGN